VVLAESGAIIEYIIAKYGNGRLVLAPDHPISRTSSTGSTSPTARCSRPPDAT